MRNARRTSAAFVCAVVCISILSGCFFVEKGTNGLAVIKRDGYHLTLAVCADTTADRLTFFESRSMGDVEEPFWEAHPRIKLLAGDELSTDPGISPPFADEIRETPPLRPGDYLLVVIDEKKGVPGIAADFEIPGEGLSETEWLGEDGETSTTKCDFTK
jgi:hypothetical protein